MKKISTTQERPWILKNKQTNVVHSSPSAKYYSCGSPMYPRGKTNVFDNQSHSLIVATQRLSKSIEVEIEDHLICLICFPDEK